MKKLNKKGSMAVEFTIAFVMISACLFIVIEFIFFALGGELMDYASYMGSRSYKVNEYANVKKVIHKIVPWVPAGEIKFEAGDLELVFDRPGRKECEDNPMWYVKGDEPCSKSF